jgi:hypothetical protein
MGENRCDEQAAIIAILDDESDRLRAMSRLLARRLPGFVVRFFDNAPDMVLWLKEHLRSCALLSLDHDLGPNRVRDGEEFDPGIGRDVVDFLATCIPACPVVIHSTNSLAAPGMQDVLETAGWAHYKVVPYKHLLWIKETWIEQVTTCLRSSCQE